MPPPGSLPIPYLLYIFFPFPAARPPAATKQRSALVESRGFFSWFSFFSVSVYTHVCTVVCLRGMTSWAASSPKKANHQKTLGISFSLASLFPRHAPPSISPWCLHPNRFVIHSSPSHAAPPPVCVRGVCMYVRMCTTVHRSTCI